MRPQVSDSILYWRDALRGVRFFVLSSAVLLFLIDKRENIIHAPFSPAGRADEAPLYITHLRTAYKPKRNFIALLDRLK